MEFPFEQKLESGKIKRKFSPDVDSDEFKWHQDSKDRNVKILQSGDWLFQIENQLPTKLNDNQEIFIPKQMWHRVIKGKSELIIEITEVD